MKTNYIWLLIVLLFGFTACENEDDIVAFPLNVEASGNPSAPNFTSGSADFSTFVSIGNSLTAGYSDGTVFLKGQAASFPNILASQFTLAGGGEFTQPLVSDDVGGLTLGGIVIAGPRLIFDAVNQVPVPFNGTPTTEVSNINPGPYNNMGVPGAKSFHLGVNGYGNIGGLGAMPATANPYFVRMASNSNASMLQDAVDMSPTFFSLWIGNNDVLGYATTGGDGSDPITPQGTFDFVMNNIVSQMVAASPDGIITNIPNVTDAPYFTTVPHNPIPLDAATAGFLNSAAAYGAYNAGIQSLVGIPPVMLTQEEADSRMISFTAGQGNAVVIMDESLSDMTIFSPALISMRQATAEDLIVLTASSFIGTEAVPGNPTTVNGVAIPLADKWVLTPSEQQEVADATTAFNMTISNLASANDLILFDVNTFFNGVATNGFQAGGAFMTADYVTGGTFSLDGIHPSPRGNAVVTNQMIDLINAKYGSNLPGVNPVDYTGVYLD